MDQAPPPQGYVDPNFPNPNGPNDAPIIIYGYRPSLAVGLLGTILFAGALVAHAVLMVRYRTWYFGLVVLGAAMEVVGYAFRVLSSQVDPYSVVFFVVAYFFIVVAPVAFSAALYAIVSALIRRTGREEFAPWPPRAILATFVACDVVATATQVAGAALIGVAESRRADPAAANRILTAGLAFQVLDFALFIALFLTFLARARKVASPALKRFAAAILLVTLAIYLRTCFRLAETAEGVQSYIFNHELFYACLEFLPIVLAVYLLAWYHPGRWLGSKHRLGKAFQDSQPQ